LVFRGSKSTGYNSSYLDESVNYLLNSKFSHSLKQDNRKRDQKLSDVRSKRLSKELQLLQQKSTDMGIIISRTGNLQWKISLCEFPENVLLASNLIDYNIKYIHLQFTFPENYPMKPPFISILSPRILCETGQITSEGALALSCLTPKNWLPVTNVNGLIGAIREILFESKSSVDPVNLGINYDTEKSEASYWTMADSQGWS